jgi:hypothetical protein
VKKESIPHRAKAKLTPPRNQFHFLTEARKCFLAITQIDTPTAATNIASPAPNNSRELCHTPVTQTIKRGTNKYSNTTTTMSDISLRIIGEVKKRLHHGWLFSFFRFGLNIVCCFALAITC